MRETQISPNWEVPYPALNLPLCSLKKNFAPYEGKGRPLWYDFNNWRGSVE